MKNYKIENYFEGEPVWQGRAKENDSLAVSLINMLPFVFVWLALELIVLSYTAINKALGENFNTYYLILVIAAILLHLIPTSIWLIGALKENARVSAEEYAMTGDKLIISRSNERESVEYLELSSVTEMRLRRSLGSLFTSTGNIVFETEGTSVILHSVENADKVFKTLYRAVMGGRNE